MDIKCKSNLSRCLRRILIITWLSYSQRFYNGVNMGLGGKATTYIQGLE